MGDSDEGDKVSKSVKSQSDDQPSAAKKLKSIDTDAWLEDVICIGETVEEHPDAAALEVERYIATKVTEADTTLNSARVVENQCNVFS